MEENEVLDVANSAAKRQKKPIFKILGIVVLILSGVLLLGVLAVSLYMDHLIGLMNRVDGTDRIMTPEELENYMQGEKEAADPDFSGEILSPEDAVPETVGQAPAEDNHVVNILLIGHDTRPGEARARSDSMILCSIDPTQGKLTVVSFLRDMYVSIPDYCNYKMNAAYAWGDMELLNRTVRANFGIEIDGDLAVSFHSFQKVIDEIGGVELYLTASEARYLNPNRYSQGKNLLDGADALTYARLRSIGDGDFSRTSRQQNVIGAILEKCKALSLPELNALLETLLPLVETNMTAEQIKNYGLQLLPLLHELTCNSGLRIPAEGTYQYAWVSGMSVLAVDLTENRQLLHNALYNS